MNTSAKNKELKQIEKEIKEMVTSPLYSYRIKNNYKPVFGEGSSDAEIMFIGEAPGKNEALNGKPFCGSSGKILDNLLVDIQILRKDTYITNIVKDRPEKNRDPSEKEINLYGPFLEKEISIIEPKVIVTLGRYAMQYVMMMLGLNLDNKQIGDLHGTIHKAKFDNKIISVIPQYHPAATIYNRKLIDVLKKDFEQIKKIV